MKVGSHRETETVYSLGCSHTGVPYDLTHHPLNLHPTYSGKVFHYWIHWIRGSGSLTLDLNHAQSVSVNLWFSLREERIIFLCRSQSSKGNWAHLTCLGRSGQHFLALPAKLPVAPNTNQSCMDRDIPDSSLLPTGCTACTHTMNS